MITKRVDLVLIKPGNQKKLYGVLSDSLSGLEPPLWAALIASFARKECFSVLIIDAEVDNLSPDETANQVIEYKPLLAAVIVSGTNPSASTPAMPAAVETISALKKRSPSVKTMLAGLHPSALPEQTMRESVCDFVCEGEGFYTTIGLLQTLKANKDNFNIKGLWYRKGTEIIHNPRAQLFSDLNELPSASWDLLPMEKYRAHNWHCFGRLDQRQPYAVIYTSLGCPFSCKFCCINAIFGQAGIRFRNPRNVVDEIGHLVENYKLKNIKIMDEMFVFNEKHVLDICGLIIERGYDLNIWAYARVDTINEKMLKKMKQAGINWLGIGIESGNSHVRQGVAKGKFDQNKIRDSVNAIHAAGIYVGANYIFGLPDDTLETMLETLDFAKGLNCEYANFYCAMAYPGSKLYQEALKQNMRLAQDWLGFAQFSRQTTPLPTKFLSSEEVLRFRDKAFEEYFSGPRYMRMIKEKFGEPTVAHIRQMLERKLKRDLLIAQ